MNDDKMLQVVFFCTSSGREPVREWLKDLDKEDRKAIGEDIKLVQFRWPLGLPWVRKMKPNLWEIRSNLDGRRIARIFITVRDNQIALLLGFVKTTQKTPLKELNTAISRKDLWLSE